jgi:ubiquitin C-terminal hydrolase
MNLLQFTREGINTNLNSGQPLEEYNYILKGVVVHSGTAEFGHYYSFIRHEEDKWLRFDDSKISSFDVR